MGLYFQAGRFIGPCIFVKSIKNAVEGFFILIKVLGVYRIKFS